MNAELRTELRVADGRQPEPSAAVLDSQSVKTTETPGVRDYDAGKSQRMKTPHSGRNDAADVDGCGSYGEHPGPR